MLAYAQHYPLESADLQRASVLSAWMVEQHDKSSLRAVGTVAQALSDVSDRMRIYSERVPAMSLWQAELAHEAIAELRASLRTSSDRLDASWMQMLRTLRVEREALAANIASERESVTAAGDPPGAGHARPAFCRRLPGRAAAIGDRPSVNH